jgi:hypothetical protein
MKYREVFGQLDNPDWLLNQYSDSDYRDKAAREMAEQDVRNHLLDYHWIMHEMLWHERDSEKDERPLYHALGEITDPEWLMKHSKNYFRAVLDETDGRQLRWQLADYWYIVHKLLVLEQQQSPDPEPVHAYRKAFSQLDDPDWLLMDQCGDRYNYLFNLARATTEHELRDSVEDYTWTMRELLLQEREQHGEYWCAENNGTRDKWHVYNAVSEVCDPEWLITNCYTWEYIQNTIANTSLQDLQWMLTDYRYVAHNLLRLERNMNWLREQQESSNV